MVGYASSERVKLQNVRVDASTMLEYSNDYFLTLTLKLFSWQLPLHEFVREWYTPHSQNYHIYLQVIASN